MLSDAEWFHLCHLLVDVLSHQGAVLCFPRSGDSSIPQKSKCNQKSTGALHHRNPTQSLPHTVECPTHPPRSLAAPSPRNCFLFFSSTLTVCSTPGCWAGLTLWPPCTRQGLSVAGTLGILTAGWLHRGWALQDRLVACFFLGGILGKGGKEDRRQGGKEAGYPKRQSLNPKLNPEQNLE